MRWFQRTVGKPRRTISAGESAGGMTATVLAEHNPQRFNGVLTFCGVVGGGVGYRNSGLDLTFAVKTLLNADFELIKIKDPQANQAKVFDLINAAATGDPATQARLSLAAALADLPGWFDPTAPRPAGVTDQIFWQGF